MMTQLQQADASAGRQLHNYQNDSDSDCEMTREQYSDNSSDYYDQDSSPDMHHNQRLLTSQRRATDGINQEVLIPPMAITT